MHTRLKTKQPQYFAAPPIKSWSLFFQPENLGSAMGLSLSNKILANVSGLKCVCELKLSSLATGSLSTTA